MRKPPKYKGGGGVPKIDRSKFQEHLSRPLNYGNNVVSADTVGLAPAAVKGLGLEYYSGNLKNKDIVYKKGDRFFIYNEDPSGGQYGLVDIGNPFNQQPTVQAAPVMAQKKPMVIDPMKVVGYNGILAPEKLKKGGKVKGYEWGGGVSKYEYDMMTPEEQAAHDKELALRNQKINSNAATLAGLAAMGTEIAGTAIDANNQPNDLGQVNAGKAGLSTGLKYAGKGAAMGASLGSVIPGVGTAIGAGAGALVGGVAGFIKGKKDAKESNEENLAEIEAEKAAKATALANQNIFKAKAQRDLAMYMNGGTVKGPGTGTSDSVSAKVKPGSFVIPAEITKALKETIVKKAPKRAKLNQSGGTDVKLSDGEMLLDEKDKNKLLKAGLDVNALAPNAEGGPEYANAGEVDDPFASYRASTKEKRQKEYEAKRKEYLDLYKKAHAPNATSIDKSTFSRRGKELEAQLREGEKEFGASPVTESTASTQARKAPVAGKKAIQTKPQETVEYLERKSLPLATTQSQPEINPTITEIPGTPQAQVVQQSGSQDQKTKPDYLGIGSQLMNYALPALQLGLGNKMLREAGKRPVDEIDPEYLNAIQTAKESVARATQEAKFGFSAPERFQIDQSNTGAYRDARFGARNFSGGSASTGFAMDRQAVNDYFSRALDTRIKDRQLKLQKEGVVDQKQSYLDGLISHKAAMERNLFGDKLNAWNQNQQAGSALIGAGISNAIGANRYNQELQYNRERDEKYGASNPYQNII